VRRDGRVKTSDSVSARSLRDPRKRNRAEILQAKGGFPRERNTISELILRKSSDPLGRPARRRPKKTKAFLAFNWKMRNQPEINALAIIPG
jgi:hypothetical protein